MKRKFQTVSLFLGRQIILLKSNKARFDSYLNLGGTLGGYQAKLNSPNDSQRRLKPKHEIWLEFVEYRLKIKFRK
jgi:hypothetical protein